MVDYKQVNMVDQEGQYGRLVGKLWQTRKVNIVDQQVNYGRLVGKYGILVGK